MCDIMLGGAMEGEHWRVEFYTDARGRVPAYEFVESLSAGEHAAALRVVDLLARYGPQLRMPHAGHVTGALMADMLER